MRISVTVIVLVLLRRDCCTKRADTFIAELYRPLLAWIELFICIISIVITSL